MGLKIERCGSTIDGDPEVFAVVLAPLGEETREAERIANSRCYVCDRIIGVDPFVRSGGHILHKLCKPKELTLL